MRLFFLLLVFSSYFAAAQGDPLQNGLLVKPHFIPGDTLTYVVTEEEKTSDLFITQKGSHEFEVRFIILDTTDGIGIKFESRLVNAIKQKFTMESFKDQLRDGISLQYRLSKEGWLIDLPDYRRNQNSIIDKLDSTYNAGSLSERDGRLLNYLLRLIRQPSGLELLLKPVIVFNELYTKPAFRTQKDYHPASSHNIFYMRQITGVMSTKLRQFDRERKVADLAIDFVAHSDSALAYYNASFREVYFTLKQKYPGGYPDRMKLETSSGYTVNTETGYPDEIHHRTSVFYLAQSRSEIKMKRSR